jgi:hypothetical protein
VEYQLLTEVYVAVIGFAEDNPFEAKGYIARTKAYDYRFVSLQLLSRCLTERIDFCKRLAEEQMSHRLLFSNGNNILKRSSFSHSFSGFLSLSL